MREQKYAVVFDYESAVVTGTGELLRRLTPSFHFAVLSPFSMEETGKKLRKVLGDDAVVIEHIVSHKGLPQQNVWEFLEGMGLLNVKPENTVFIGSLPERVSAAAARGMTVIGRHNNACTDDALRACGASYILYQYRNLTPLTVHQVLQNVEDRKCARSVPAVPVSV
ncbi:MAG: hypothetical protein G01um101472_25 [Parcubacteria group bacterium Gr01-1014_72]|nr:MAG: hypothetical protein G01um101472_25 [Parcubacteria group bacterium Gr01-1014_72]